MTEFKMPRDKCLFFLCLCCGSCGLVLIFLTPFLCKLFIENRKILLPQTYTFNLWRKFPVAYPIDFYFFNWTNPGDIYNGATKPKFEQVGPYRFWENRENSDIIWNDNGTITYRHKKIWYFAKDYSNLQDVITTVNPVALSVVHLSRNWPYLIRKGLSMSLAGIAPTIHINRTASQLLFEGYPDPLISIAKAMPFLADSSLPLHDRFGWFYNRNGSTDFEGIYNMGTGNQSILGKLYSWNHWAQSPYYHGNCAKFDGSAGEFIEPDLTKNTISIFSSDICRMVTLKYIGKATVNNIIGNKYSLEPDMFDNGTIYPENKCSCNGECVASGVLNVSSCRYGSPAFASLPHFYNADPYFNNIIDGLKPDQNKHEFSIVLEPTTNAPLEINARLQLNLLMQPVDGVRMYEEVPKVFFPMLWFEQKVQIPENEAYWLKLFINTPFICSIVGIAIICVSVMIPLFCAIRKICSKMDTTKRTLYEQESVPLKTKI